MAKGTKKFSKQSIDVRVTALPSGEEAVTYNLEQSVASLLTSIASGMGSFYLGNGLFGKDANTFIAKAKTNKKSLLGESNSIFALLEEIKSQMFSESQKSEIIYHLNKQTQILSNGLICSDSTPFIALINKQLSDLVQSLSQTKENTVSSKDDDKLLKDINLAISSQIQKPFDDINEQLKEIIKSYIQTIQNYDADNREKLKLLGETKEAQIRILLESTNASTIDDLMKFANENTDKLISNIDNMQKFFESLKTVEGLTISDTLSSLSNVSQLFNAVNELIEKTNNNIDLFDDNTISAIEKIFGKKNQNGIIKTILLGINDLPDLAKEKQEEVLKSLKAVTNIFVTTFGMLAIIYPFVLAFQKPMEFITVGIERIFVKLGQVFKAVDHFKTNNIDNELAKSILDNIKNLRKVLKNAHLLAIESWVIYKAIGEGEYITRVDDILNKIATLMTSVSVDFKAINTENAVKTIESFKTIMDAIDSLSQKKNFKRVEKNLNAYFDNVELFYKKLEEKYETIVKTAEKIDALKEANKKIREGIDDITETAVKTSKETNDINKGITSLEGLTEFMISAAVVMSIGALFMMLGGGKFAKAALEFGITLMAFEMLVITPILMFRGIQKNIEQSLNGLSSFVITCTIMMSVGALFIQLGGGKFVKNALTFGIILGIFEMLVVAPFLAFYKHQTNIMKGLSEFSTFLITTTIIMSVGALFMNLGGGKFAKNALTFGVVLGIFEMLVVAPFILFSKIKEDVFESADKFVTVLITCTTILLIGALFMSIKNGALARNGLKFAATLMLFEAMVIAPFLLMNALKSQVFNGMKLFSTIIISSTIILMVGALFMSAKGGQLWKQSLKFTALLFAFEVGVIIPFLLFRKMEDQAIKGLIGFGAIVIASATILMVGSLFMSMNNGLNGLYALEFTAVLSAFVLALGGVATALTKWLGNKEIVKMEEFGIFVLLSTAALITGALFIEKYGPWSVIGYGIILSGFVALMAVVAGKLTKFLDNKALVKMDEFGVFVMLSSLALISGALFVKMYGVGSVIEYAVCLLGFVTITTLVVSLIAKFINAQTLVDMSLLGTFLLMATGSMILGAWFIEKYGVGSVFAFMGMLLLYITEAGLIMFALQLAAPYIIGGIVTAALLGVALFTLTTSIMMINALFLLDPHGKKTQENIATLTSIISWSLMGTFVALGALAILIIPGTLAAAAIGVSMLILGGSLALVNYLIGHHGTKIQENIKILKNILGDLKWVYVALGLLSPFIAVGSVAAVAIGVSMTVFASSLWIIHKTLDGLGYERFCEELKMMGIIVGGLVIFALALNTLEIPLIASMIVLGLLNMFSIGLSSAILMVNHAVQEISKSGDLSKNIDLATNNLKKFIEIPDKIFDGNWLKNLSRINDLYRLKQFTRPMTEIMLETAKAIQSMAELKVPSNWDKDGNAISYRQLKDHDFELAIKNTGKLLKTMSVAFYDTWEGEGDHRGKGLKALYTKNYRAIDNIVNFGIKSGEVIKGISEGIANMAKLQIPIAWDENGHPIGYRQLSTQDFSDAATGTRIILMSMAESIASVYGEGEKLKQLTKGKNVFDFDELDGSPFGNTLEASFKMAELIGKVGTVVGNIAKMQIPEEWDSKGNVTGYRKLNSNDFKQMGENVKTILGAISQCIGDLYYEGRPGGELNKNFYSGNIFDAISSGSLFKDDQSSHFEQVLGASFKMSELISNIGQGIKDIAVMQIADDWDEKGHAIHYKHLTSTDFKNAGISVAKIVTGIVDGLKGVKLDTVETTAEIINAMMPINELISGMADGIIKIAAGQIPVYEADGKTIKEYKHLEPNDYEKAGQSIGLVVNAIATQIQKIAKDDKQQINKIFTDGTFEDISKSLGSMTGLVSGIVDSVIKIGTCQIPDAWDKNGNPTHYKPVDLSQAQVDLTSTVSNIISAMSTAVITAYKNNEEIFAENPSGNTPFAIAVKGITGVTKIVSEITDSVVKISQAQIPTKWNDQGSPIWYEKVNINTAIANIKKIFNDPDNGLLNILCNVINTTYDTWFSRTNNITEKVGPIATNIGKITKLISSSSDIIVKLSSLSIPESFDKDGNGKNYHKINENDINIAKTNAINIITALFDIPKEITIDDNLKIEEWTSTTISNISKIGGVISAATGVAEKFAKYQEIANKLFGNKTKVEKFDASFTKDLTTNIELIKGIYEINLQQNIESKSSIERIASDLNNFVTYGINSFDKTALERFNMLNKSMNTIYETFKKQKDVSANIKNNTNQLSNYIKAINTIQVSKVDSLTNLVRELNIFSDRMGNLDKLTEAIAEKLSVVLANLVEKLEESKKTIETAETIQTKRHKLIDDSIKKVKEIMENPINVLVSSDTTESEDDGRGQGQTNESDDSKSSGDGAYAELDARKSENNGQQPFPERPAGVEIPKLFGNNTKGGGGS